MALSIKGVTVSGRALASKVSVTSFSITPSVESKSVWDLSTDGSLNLGTHGEWTIVPSADITVSTKMWGAGGSLGFDYTQNYNTATSGMGTGGGSGYSTATITLKADVSYILRVGQGGARTNVESNATYLAGGVNNTPTKGGAQGGGYTGIFKTSVSQGNTLLMAGGGGGGSWSGGDISGGGGGGVTAGSGTMAFNGQGGYGGTGVAGGGPSTYNGATAGTALTGGKGAGSGQASLGGGGGGYYGGGGGNVGGGGGGSGRVGTDPDVSSGSTTVSPTNGTPANSGDTDRNGAGQGGTTVNSLGVTPVSITGAPGRAIISLV